MSYVAIAAEGLSKRYGGFEALRGLDLEVSRGEVFGLVGQNGAGKTTFLRLLLDLLRPSAGSVLVLGQEPRAGGAALRRRVGYLPGDLRLEGRARVGELLEHLARLAGPLEPGAVGALAERLGLDLSRRVGELSKGNRQKVGLVQAFAHRPELLVLDEPTSGLDPVTQEEFLALVREARGRGQTVLLSSHVLGEVERAADTVGVLHAGQLVRVGSVSELREGQRRRVRAAVRSAPGLSESLASLAGVSGLEVEARDGEALVRLTVEGGLDGLVKALARFEVRDLVVEELELGEAIAAYYRGARP